MKEISKVDEMAKDNVENECESTPTWQQILKIRVDEVLHYKWDPICMKDEPAARDEYSSHVPIVMDLLLDDASRDQIAEYLAFIEKEYMEFGPNIALAQQVAEMLLDWRDWLRDDFPNLIDDDRVAELRLKNHEQLVADYEKNFGKRKSQRPSSEPG